MIGQTRAAYVVPFLIVFATLGLCINGSNLRAQTMQPTLRDGQHDFDFHFGVWHTHIRRVLNPLSGGNKCIELDGTVTVRKVWGGRASLEEIEADGPKGHWEAMTLFLYNPGSHQWSQSYLNAKTATLTTPLIGEFHDGRGEMFSQDTVDSKSILVRGTWSDIKPDSHHYAEAYSQDGGKTWAPAFFAELTRLSDPPAASGAPPMAESTDAGGPHAFDFDLGSWKTQSTRLMHPLAGAKDWVELDGHTIVQKIWNGRANLAEYKAEGPSGAIELLALRWFNPNTREWNLDFATPNVGTLGVPGIGIFKDGRADFYDYEPISGRSVLVRFSIWRISDNAAQSEQAFSADGGTTWEVNWVNKYTRLEK